MAETNTEKMSVEIPEEFLGKQDLFKMGYPEGTEFYEPGQKPEPPPPPPTTEPEVKNPITDAEPPKPPETPAVPEQVDYSRFGDNIKSLEDLEKEYNGLRQARESLTSELEKAKAFNPFEDEVLYKLAVIKKETPDQYDLYKKLALGEPDSLAIMKLGLTLENPEFKDKAEEYIKVKYPFLFDDEPDTDSKEYKRDSLQFELDAKTEYKKLMKRFEGIEKPKIEDVSKQRETDIDNLKKDWSAPFKTEVESAFKTFAGSTKFQIDEQNDLEVSYDIPIEEKENKEILSLVANYAVQNELKPTKDNIQLLNNFAKNLYITRNFNTIIATALEKVYKDTVEETTKKYYNPSAPPSAVKKDEGEKELTPAEKEEARLNHYISTGRAAQ